jgi:O-antigen/teichoic acid export membrane protein
MGDEKDNLGTESVVDTEKKQLLPNAALATVQVIVTSATLFFLYRYLLSTQGIDALGVWSLVVAATSLATISNLGLAGGTVRFVSKYLAHKDERSAAQAVETSTLSVAVVMAFAILLIWPASGWLLSVVVPSKWVGAAHELLPYTLGALWLNSVGGAIHSGLDGCHRADQRSLATIVTQPLLLLLVFWLVPKIGLKGLAYAQIFQYLAWVGIGWVLLRRQLPTLSYTPWRWSKALFLEMWRYGLNFQLIAIMGMLAEPLLKGLISYFGNLGAVGYFEMANRLVGQVRSLPVSANQVFVPYYSKVKETAYEEIKLLYQKNLNIIIMLSSLLFSTLVALLPLISELWIGKLEPQFLLFSLMLTVGWFVNIVAVPAYYANLGGGWISRNLYCQVVQTATTVIFGIAGGMFGGATGSAVAWPLALILGALVVSGLFHRAEHIPVSVFFKAENTKALGLGGAIALFGFTSYFLVPTMAGFLSAAIAPFLILFFGWAMFFITIPGTGSFARTLYRQIVLRGV